MVEKMTQRQKQAAQTKARIQQTALELFDRYGFEHVSIEAIARKAGCSVGNIYHYFPNKDSLTILMTDYVDMIYRDNVARYFGSDSMTPREKLIDFTGLALSIDSNQELLYQCFVHSIKYPDQGFLKIDENKVYFNTLRRLVHEFCEAETVRVDSTEDDVMDAFVQLNRGMLLEWRIEEEGFDISERGRKVAQVLLDGFAPQKKEE